MKKYVIRMVALLVLASFTISSCSVEYRERRMHRHDNDHNHGNDHDHHYDQTRHY